MSRKDPEQRSKIREWKARERAGAEGALPASPKVLLSLFDELDARLCESGCDHSLRFTLAWADKAGVDPDRLADWTREYGGYCDCEVLANVPDTNPALRT